MSEQAVVEDEIEEIEVTEESTEDNTEDDELIVTIGDDEPEEQEAAPDWVKDLRKTNRDLKKKLKAAEAKELERQQAKEQEALGEKPKFSDYDYDDEEKFEQDLLEWNRKKQKLEDQKKAAEDQERENTEKYQAKLAEYEKNKTALPVSDIDEIEELVKEKLSVQQHAIAIHALEKPELFMLAVGRNQKILENLAKITDPVKYAVEIGKIEAQLKTSSGKRSPEPETRLKGSAPVGISADKHLDKLEKEAEKTGDRTKIIEYKRSLKK